MIPAVLPLGVRELTRLEITQRKILWLIVGWRRITDEPLENTMTRMKRRVEQAFQYHRVDSWRTTFFGTDGGMRPMLADR